MLHIRVVDTSIEIMSFIASILLFLYKSKYCYVASESFNSNHYSNTSVHLFRFRDFEPRYISDEPAIATSAAIDAADYKDARDSGGGGSDNNRKARGFQFHANQDDIVIDIEFIVPFMRIPVERSMSLTTSAFRNLINLNTNSLLWSGAIVTFGAAIAFIFKLLTAPFHTVTGGYTYGKKSSREVDDAFGNAMTPFHFITYGQNVNVTGEAPTKHVTKVTDFMTLMESKLLENKIDMSACIQKSICNYISQSTAVVRKGKASGIDKIIDGLTNLDSLRSYLNGSAIQNAIDSGVNSKNCERVYANCNWPQPGNKVMRFLINYFKYLSKS